MRTLVLVLIGGLCVALGYLLAMNHGAPCFPSPR